MTSLGDVLYVWGGLGAAGDSAMGFHAFNDLHAFDTVELSWSPVGPAAGITCDGGSIPAARYGMGLAGLGSVLLLFGGLGNAGTLNDFFVINPSSVSCSKPSPSGAAPSSRAALTMAAAGIRIFVFGGKQGIASGLLNDIWTFTGPADLPWPLDARAGRFIDVYDWDTLIVDSSDGLDSLAMRVVLCTRLFPCTLHVVGVGDGFMIRKSDGSIKCSSGLGCTGVRLEGVQVVCNDAQFSSNPVLDVDGVALEVKGGQFRACRTIADGGVVRCFGGGSLRVANSSFESVETLGSGGAVAAVGCSALLEDTAFNSCVSRGVGGAMFVSGYSCYGGDESFRTSVKMLNCRFSRCASTGSGGAIAVDSSQSFLSLQSSVLVRCTSNASGGAISITDGATVGASDLNLIGNHARAGGGALFADSSSSCTFSRANFTSNIAVGSNGGGAIFTNSTPMMLQKVLFKNNSASAGGGGAIFWSLLEPQAVLDNGCTVGGGSEGFDAPVNTSAGNNDVNCSQWTLTLLECGLCGAGNRAMYGECVASGYDNLLAVGMPELVYPGIQFEITVFKKDWYNQTMVTDSGSTIQSQAVDTWGTLGVITGDLLRLLDQGTASLSLAVKPAFIRVDTVQGVTELKSQLALFITGNEVDTGLDMSAGTLDLHFSSGFSVCPSGHTLSFDGTGSDPLARVGYCSLCGARQYSVSPLAGPTAGIPGCFNCPLSAECLGGSDVVFSRGQWVIANGMYTLVGCPRGYQLVNKISGQFSHDAQDCVRCATNQYIADSNKSAYSCQNCPLGASCDGSSLTSLVPGAVWALDTATGRYFLKSCPPGYEYQAQTADSQQCMWCFAAYFCVGGTSEATQCPAGTYAPPGSGQAADCKAAVTVEMATVLPISKDEFGDNQTISFLEAVAAVAMVDPSYVYILQVTNTARRRALNGQEVVDYRKRGVRSQQAKRTVRLATIGIQVTADVAVESNARAKEVAGLLTKVNLDAALQTVGLPKCDGVTARAVLASDGSSDTGSSTNALFASLAAIGVIWIFYRRYRGQASYRAFLVAFRTAKAGDKADKRFTPFNMRKTYAAETVLGRGAFGCVVKMRTIKGGQAVAIKLLIPERGALFEDREKRQMIREAAVLELMTSRKCEHAVHLAGVDAVVVRAEIAWFVLEYLHGDNLDMVIRDPERGPVSDSEAIRAARNVLAALKVMHSEGLVHRDIKPANIMRCTADQSSSGSRGTSRMQTARAATTNVQAPLSGEWTAGTTGNPGAATYKLIDFGTALGVDEQLAREEMMTMGAGRAVGAGTPPYMSPEMFKEPERAMYPTDLWSLGVTMFEAVSGVLPFPSESDLLYSVAIAGNMDEEAPSVLDRLPDDRRSKFDHNLARVIAQALEKHVCNRFQSVDEMHNAVYACLIERGEAVYSVFISYRVATDLPLARLLFDCLNHTVTPGGNRVTVYLDNARLVKGEDWEEGFASGLLHSLCFFPLLSYGATAPLADIPLDRREKAFLDGWGERPAGRARLCGQDIDVEDNLLKEFIIAVSLLERRQDGAGRNLKQAGGDNDSEQGEGDETELEVAYPILAGRPHPPGHPRFPGMGNFFLVQGGGGRYPETASPASAKAAAEFLQRRAGFDSDAAEVVRRRGVEATVKGLTALQGCQLWDVPAGLTAVELSKEQSDLVGKGFAGPPVDLEGVALTEEQRSVCGGGMLQAQLQMLKAQVLFHLSSFHEIIDRATVARQERLRALEAVNQSSVVRRASRITASAMRGLRSSPIRAVAASRRAPPRRGSSGAFDPGPRDGIPDAAAGGISEEPAVIIPQEDGRELEDPIVRGWPEGSGDGKVDEDGRGNQAHGRQSENGQDSESVRDVDGCGGGGGDGDGECPGADAVTANGSGAVDRTPTRVNGNRHTSTPGSGPRTIPRPVPWPVPNPRPVGGSPRGGDEEDSSDSEPPPPPPPPRLGQSARVCGLPVGANFSGVATASLTLGSRMW
mmetsp:Transcript_16498/g.44884  ORF Transcript_16498/g.44884 Transcript_16498/m.44884 type:complete len:1970 (+) Transcript_16498:1-5910(+)